MEKDDSKVMTIPMEEEKCVCLRGIKSVKFSKNSCWLSSILQCIKHTLLFIKYFENSFKNNTIVIPGGRLIEDDELSEVLPPLECELLERGVITEALHDSLKELNDANRRSSYKPLHLFYYICLKYPRIHKQSHQCDVQEIFIWLLQQLQNEEKIRQYLAILHKMNISPDADPNSVDDYKKAVIIFYTNRIPRVWKSPVKQVFIGLIKNTLICHCCNIIHGEEPFFCLNLSLPRFQKKPDQFKKNRKEKTSVSDADDEDSESNESTIVRNKLIEQSSDSFDDIPTKSDCSLESCLQRLLVSKISTISCKKCKQNDENYNKNFATRKFTILHQDILEPPLVLVLNLIRFENINSQVKKNSTFVRFPLVLDLTSFCHSDYLNSQDRQVLYSLYAVQSNLGKAPERPFNVAYIKMNCIPNSKKSFKNTRQKRKRQESPPTIQSDENWYYTRNETVRMVSVQDVLKAQAYVLFYKRYWV